MPYDLNHGSGPLLGGGIAPRAPITFSGVINRYVDTALQRRREREATRNYIGLSEIGDPCLRKLYYKDVKAPAAAVEPRMLRIFELGHAIEALLIEWLREAGFVIINRDPATGAQWEVRQLDGRLQGHIDGKIVDGPPIPGVAYPLLLECKGLANKYWNQAIKKGVELAEPKYFVQTQEYMGYMAIPQTLLGVVNKDTSELYWEYIPYQEAVAQKYSDRAVSLFRAIETNQVPPRIAARADFYRCKMCEFRDTVCWSSAA